MEEQTRVDKDYLEAFNQGYEVAKELGLKSKDIEGINAGKNRMQAMYDGIKQYEKELELDKNRDVIPQFDMDSINNSIIDLTEDKENKNKDFDKDL